VSPPVFLWQTFYMPTKSDEGVRAFRQWISKFGGKAPAWAVSLPSRAIPFLDAV
jgi:hypothetical protein